MISLINFLVTFGLAVCLIVLLAVVYDLSKRKKNRD